jgi:hypothetical protein
MIILWSIWKRDFDLWAKMGLKTFLIILQLVRIHLDVNSYGMDQGDHVNLILLVKLLICASLVQDCNMVQNC